MPNNKPNSTTDPRPFTARCTSTESMQGHFLTFRNHTTRFWKKLANPLCRDRGLRWLHPPLLVAPTAAFLFLASIPQLRAQVGDPIAQRGVYPNGAYAFDKLEAINLLTGNLTYTIPITTMPMGRGGMSLPINLVYNSSLVDGLPYAGYQNSISVTYGEAQTSGSGGWSFRGGFSYGLYEVVAPINNCTAYYNIYHNLVPVSPPPYQLGVITPDGARHLLELYNQADTGSNGAFWYNPTNGTNPCTNQTITGPLTYFTSDGSYLRASVNTSQANANGFGAPWTLYLPDGTQVSGSGFPTYTSGEPIAGGGAVSSVTDRNGNKISLTSNANNALVLTDDLGRTVTISSNTVTQTGFGGAPLTWTLGNYNTFVVPVSSCTTTGPNQGQNGCGSYVGGGPQTLTVPSDSGALTYNFQYYPTGQLMSVQLPSGATTTYSYGNGLPLKVGITSLNVNYMISQKVVTWIDQSDGGSTQRKETWNYVINGEGSASVQAPDGGVTTTTFYGTGPLQSTVSKVTLPDGSGTEYLYQQNPALLENIYGVNSNPFPAFIVHTIAQGGTPILAAIEQHAIDQNGNLKGIAKFDWVPYAQLTHDAAGHLTGGFAGATKLQNTTNTYQSSVDGATNANSPSDNPNAYWNPNAPLLRGLLLTSVVTGSGPNAGFGAVSQFTYDNFPDCGTAAPKTALHGNLTCEYHWDSSLGSTQPSAGAFNTSRLTSRTYDNAYGNLLTLTDPNGNQSKYTYGSSSPACPNQTLYPNLYPTQIVQGANSSGTPVTRTFNYCWDDNLGLVTAKLDADNNVTTTYSYDAQGRQTNVTEASGTAVARQTNTTYDDANRVVTVRQDLNPNDQALASVTAYDQLYRVRLTKQLQNGDQSNTSDSDGIKVQTRYAQGTINGLTGNFKLVSNPYCGVNTSAAANSAVVANLQYCSGVSSATGSEQTMGWTLTSLDTLGRPSSVTTYDGAAPPAPFGNNTKSTGQTTFAYYSGVNPNSATSSLTPVVPGPGLSFTTTTDQALNTIVHGTDGLGRLRWVQENAGTAGSYATLYDYDALGDLVGVTQNGQTKQSRIFAYDSLKRLSSANNPESGTISYTYYANGNLFTKLDANGTKTTFNYDSLNRATSKSYTLGAKVATTNTVKYTYDSATGAAKGQLVSVSNVGTAPNPGSVTTFNNFDALGRPATSTQTTGAYAYTFNYTYNLAGSILTEQLPSGRVLTSTYDTLNRPTSISAGSKTYVSNVGYWPHGAVYSYQRNNGLSYGATYNSRLQPTELDEALGTNPTNSTFLLVSCPSWGLGSGPATGPYGACPLSTFSSQNNGNLQSVIASTAANTPTPFSSTTPPPITQTFSYDGLNRIKTATDNGSGTTLERDFSYDAFGNMWVTRNDANLLPTSVMPVPTAQGAYNSPSNNNLPNNNQFVTGKTIAYDKSGNQTTIGPYSLTYDAENRQYSESTSGSAPANYIYDGEGRRVEKQITNGAQTVYVYDAAGNLSAEYTTGANLSGCQTCYLSYDHLGSTRMVTNEMAQVIERHDYMPFGEEITTGSSGRQSPWGTATGIVNQKFTGKERDSESGLDYFGARYYGSALGRFSSADEVFADQHPADPQSWNMYGYVRNNPLRHIDPSGRGCLDPYSALTCSLPPGQRRMTPNEANGTAVGVVIGAAAVGTAGLGGEILGAIRALGTALFGWGLTHPDTVRETAAAVGEGMSNAPPGSLTGNLLRLSATELSTGVRFAAQEGLQLKSV